MAQLQDLNRVLQHQLEKMQKLQLDAAEYACLKALVLFNPGKEDEEEKRGGGG